LELEEDGGRARRARTAVEGERDADRTARAPGLAQFDVVEVEDDHGHSFRCTMACREYNGTLMCSQMARRYEQRKRAERQAATRRRIVEAAVGLHTSVGPSRTSIAAIA